MQIRHWSIREMLFGMKKQKRTEKLIHKHIHMFNAIQKSMTITKNNLLPQNKTWQGERKGKSKFLPALSLVICNQFFFLLSFSSNNYLFWVFFSLCGGNNADAEMSYLPLLCLLLFSYLPCFSWWLSPLQTLQHFCCRGAALSVGATCIVWTLLLGELSSSGLSRICFWETIL